MIEEWSNLTFSHLNHTTIVTINSDCLKENSGDFVYDPTVNFNLIERKNLASFVQINYTNFTENEILSILGSVKIPILWKEIKFCIVDTGLNSKAIGIVGKSFMSELSLPIPENQ